MELGLGGKIVLITGGSKGIGLACAKGFLADGARVAIASRNRGNLDQALTMLPAVTGYEADLADPDAAAALIGSVEAEIGLIDILVNSAGAARRTPPDELTPAAWRAAMDAKYFTYINAIDPMVKRMAVRGRGVIVNILGIGGKVASPTHIAGGAANAALMLATAGLGAAYAGRGVRVVGISPGLTETDRVAEGLAVEARLSGISLEAARARSVASLPLGRAARPEEIADAVLFVASDKASYITGVTLTVAGGLNPVVL